MELIFFFEKIKNQFSMKKTELFCQRDLFVVILDYK